MARVISIEEFKALEPKGLVLVDFYAEWCGPCKMIGPVFAELGEKHKEQASFYKVDVDKSLELAREYNIHTVPTILFFRDGVLIDSITGFLSRADLEGKLAEHL